MKTRVERLNGRHFAIIDKHLLGWTNKAIAEALDMSPQQVCVVLNSPQSQIEITRRRGKLEMLQDSQHAVSNTDVDKTIKSYLLSAANRLGYVVDDPNASTADQIRASAEILDRGGHPRVQRMENRSVSLEITGEDARLIAETMAMDRVKPTSTSEL